MVSWWAALNSKLFSSDGGLVSQVVNQLYAEGICSTMTLWNFQTHVADII